MGFQYFQKPEKLPAPNERSSIFFNELLWPTGTPFLFKMYSDKVIVYTTTIRQACFVGKQVPLPLVCNEGLTILSFVTTLDIQKNSSGKG